MKKHKITVKISRKEETEVNKLAKGFAYYLQPSIKNRNKGVVMMQIDLVFLAATELDLQPKDIKDMLLDSLMHEVGHAIQDYLNINLSEKQIRSIVKKYKKKYYK